jgi:hypothetical protein
VLLSVRDPAVGFRAGSDQSIFEPLHRAAMATPRASCLAWAWVCTPCPWPCRCGSVPLCVYPGLVPASRVRERLALLDLDSRVQEMVHRGDLPLRVALQLVPLRDQGT